MVDVLIGGGKISGKGIYAARDFEKDELVMQWNLEKISQAEFSKLSKSEQMFVHSFWGKLYLFPEPARYTNHSAKPNTKADFEKMCDYALRPIKKGEIITTNATTEVHYEVKTFIEAYEKVPIANFKWLTGGYRNAVVAYEAGGKAKRLKLKRNGNWQIV